MARPLVLLVEADLLLARKLTILLYIEGYEVAVVPHHRVLAAARDLLPRAILVNITQDYGRGLGICQHLRADPATFGTPIIAMGDTDSRSSYPGLVADDLLRMPCRKAELVAALARWVKSG